LSVSVTENHERRSGSSALDHANTTTWRLSFIDVDTGTLRVLMDRKCGSCFVLSFAFEVSHFHAKHRNSPQIHVPKDAETSTLKDPHAIGGKVLWLLRELER
jgi:hypothetical protein